MTTTDVLKVKDGGDLAVVVSHMLGFQPAQSLVVVTLRPPRQRVGNLIRIDLAGPLDDRDLAKQASRVLRGTFNETVALVYGDRPELVADREVLPRRRLVAEVEREMAARGAPMEEALLIADGRWWSYACKGPDCCPPGGKPLATAQSPSPTITRLAVEVGMPLASREELVASVDPAVPLGFAELVGRASEQLFEAWPTIRERTTLLRRLLLGASLRPDGMPGREDAATLIALVQHSHVRDAAILDVAPVDRDAAVAVWSLLLRWAPPGFVAQTAVTLAALAYGNGQCTLATAGIDRALDVDPTHKLSLMIATLLQNGVDPKEFFPAPRRERRARRPRSA